MNIKLRSINLKNQTILGNVDNDARTVACIAWYHNIHSICVVRKIS